MTQVYTDYCGQALALALDKKLAAIALRRPSTVAKYSFDMTGTSWDPSNSTGSTFDSDVMQYTPA